MEKPEFTNNQCSEVVLSAENVNDLEAVVEDVQTVILFLIME